MQILLFISPSYWILFKFTVHLKTMISVTTLYVKQILYKYPYFYAVEKYTHKIFVL